MTAVIMMVTLLIGGSWLRATLADTEHPVQLIDLIDPSVTTDIPTAPPTSGAGDASDSTEAIQSAGEPRVTNNPAPAPAPAPAAEALPPIRPNTSPPATDPRHRYHQTAAPLRLAHLSLAAPPQPTLARRRLR